MRAEQEFVDRNLLEETQRFEDQGKNDSDRGQDRHDGTCNQEDLEDALHDMAGAVFRRDARPGEPASDSGKREANDPDQGRTPGMDRFERLGRRLLGGVGEADNAAERDRTRVTDEGLDLGKPHRRKFGSETANDDPGLDAGTDDRPNGQHKQGRPRRQKRQEHSVRSRKGVQARNLAVHRGERAGAAREVAANEKK